MQVGADQAAAATDGLSDQRDAGACVQHGPRVERVRMEVTTLIV